MNYVDGREHSFQRDNRIRIKSPTLLKSSPPRNALRQKLRLGEQTSPNLSATRHHASYYDHRARNLTMAESQLCSSIQYRHYSSAARVGCTCGLHDQPTTRCAAIGS